MATHLPVLEPSAISQPTDLFRCERYAAVMMGRACVQRQQRAKVAAEFLDSGDRWDRKPVGDYGKCRACPVGASVAEAVGAATSAPTPVQRGSGSGFGKRRGEAPVRAATATAGAPVRRRKRSRVCGRCGHAGHDRRICPGKNASGDD